MACGASKDGRYQPKIADPAASSHGFKGPLGPLRRAETGFARGLPRRRSPGRIVGVQASAPPTSAPPTSRTRQQLRCGVVRLDRAAVEDAHMACPPRRRRRNAQFGADEGMHGSDVGLGRGAAGADRPDRLVGDDAGKAGRQAAGELGARPPRMAVSRSGACAFAPRSRPTQTIGVRPAAPRGDRLGADDRLAGLAVIGATFGMADDHPGWRPASSQHRRGDVAGMGARGASA